MGIASGGPTFRGGNVYVAMQNFTGNDIYLIVRYKQRGNSYDAKVTDHSMPKSFV